jgi:hypothetical protein
MCFPHDGGGDVAHQTGVKQLRAQHPRNDAGGLTSRTALPEIRVDRPTLLSFASASPCPVELLLRSNVSALRANATVLAQASPCTVELLLRSNVSRSESQRSRPGAGTSERARLRLRQRQRQRGSQKTEARRRKPTSHFSGRSTAAEFVVREAESGSESLSESVSKGRWDGICVPQIVCPLVGLVTTW